MQVLNIQNNTEKNRFTCIKDKHYCAAATHVYRMGKMNVRKAARSGAPFPDKHNINDHPLLLLPTRRAEFAVRNPLQAITKVAQIRKPLGKWLVHKMAYCFQSETLGHFKKPTFSNLLQKAIYLARKASG